MGGTPLRATWRRGGARRRRLTGRRRRARRGRDRASGRRQRQQRVPRAPGAGARPAGARAALAAIPRSSRCRPSRRRGSSARLDLRRSAAGTHDRRQAVLTADDRGMGHDAADVRDHRLDVREDRRPGRRRDRADEDVAVAHVSDLPHVDHDARDALDRRPATPALPSARDRPPPGSPTARTRSVVMPQSMFSTGSSDRLGHDADGGRRSPVLESLEDLLAACDDRRPVLRAQRLAAGGPHQDELVERRLRPRAGRAGRRPRRRRGSRGSRVAHRTRAPCSTIS